MMEIFNTPARQLWAVLQIYAAGMQRELFPARYDGSDVRVTLSEILVVLFMLQATQDVTGCSNHRRVTIRACYCRYTIHELHAWRIAGRDLDGLKEMLKGSSYYVVRHTVPIHQRK